MKNHLTATLLVASMATLTSHVVAQEPVADPAARINAFFEKSFQEQINRSPIRQGYLGIKKDYRKWDDLSDQAATEELALKVRQLSSLRNDFDYERLKPQEQLSFRIFEDQAERAIASFPWRFHQHPINQMFGVHSRLPSFLINAHRIDSVVDAEAYVARLSGMSRVFDQVISRLRVQRRQGIVPPRFMLPLVMDDCRNVISGQPFDDADTPSTLWKDFEEKVSKLPSISTEETSRLLKQAREALLNDVRPAYQRLIETLEELAAVADDDAGVWKLPHGDDYYSHQLRLMTTTQLSADEIHEIGVKEVARIHGEMEAVSREVKFDGSLRDFFAFMRNDEQFYYANTEEGRRRYLQEAKGLIDRMRASLDFMFITKPKADMMVKRVEPFREKSAGTAFYMPGTPDGSRAGIYYANLFDMRRMPIYQMEALAFHEGIPGHHMQLSIAQELTGIPKFRRFGQGYSAYVEGWGLYCELLPKEFGYYKDPYSDFGRLAMELWRAARLVVDTGLHHKRWSRQQAIDYLIDNTPDAKDECVRAINRYLVMPGQATAYKIGMLRILELRKTAMGQLGESFDIRQFHDVILANGAMPLDLLEEQVQQWIEAKQGTS